MSVVYFIHQRPSAISDEPRFDRPSGVRVGAQLQRLHIPGITGAAASIFLKLSLASSGGWGGGGPIDSVRCVCMLTTPCQIMSRVSCWCLSLPTACRYLSRPLLIPRCRVWAAAAAVTLPLRLSPAPPPRRKRRWLLEPPTVAAPSSFLSEGEPPSLAAVSIGCSQLNVSIFFNSRLGSQCGFTHTL